MEVFDKDGNVVEGVFSQAELDAKVAAEKTTWEASQAPVTPVVPVTPSADEPPVWAKDLISRVENLSGNQKTMVVSSIAESLDLDKKTQLHSKYD